MNNFFDWLRTYDTEISWFLAGFLISSGLASLGKNEWGNALFYFAVAGINIFLNIFLNKRS
jgi:hypothetical protein